MFVCKQKNGPEESCHAQKNGTIGGAPCSPRPSDVGERSSELLEKLREAYARPRRTFISSALATAHPERCSA